MLIKPYETIIILDAHLSGDQTEAIITKYQKHIETNGGKIKLIDRWGKRRLAYEISRKQYGYYVYLRFDSEGSLIKPLEREFKLNDKVLRYLTVFVPKAALLEEEKQADVPATDEKDTPPVKKDQIADIKKDEESPEVESGDKEENNEQNEIVESKTPGEPGGDAEDK